MSVSHSAHDNACQKSHQLANAPANRPDSQPGVTRVDLTPNAQTARRLQQFIRDHLGEPITLLMLARVVGYSPWHVIRIFEQETGLTPFAYVRSLRLARAAVALRDGEQRVVDVALDFAFGSHESFTRAFSDNFGMAPRIYRRQGRPLFLPAGIREAYLSLQKGEEKMTDQKNTVFVQVVDRPARKALIRRGIVAADYYEYCEEVGCEIWDQLCAIPEALYEPIGMWLPERFRHPGTSTYVQGVELPATWNGIIPDGLECVEFPPCKMMIFQGPPFDDANFEAAIIDVWALMKQYDPTLYGFCWADDDGPRFQLEPRGERGYIEGRPVRQL